MSKRLPLDSPLIFAHDDFTIASNLASHVVNKVIYQAIKASKTERLQKRRAVGVGSYVAPFNAGNISRKS